MLMWIFTKHGFFSAVCARQGNGKHSQPVDPDRIMVRARLRGHLDALKKRFPDLLGECEIQESAETDYAYRLFVQKLKWIAVACSASHISNFFSKGPGATSPLSKYAPSSVAIMLS